MTLSVAVIDALVAAGATVEQLAAAVKADLAEGEERARLKREKDAARQRKSRASRNVTVTPCDSADPPPNDIYSNPPPNPDGTKVPSSPLPDRVVSAWNEGPGKRGATAARALDAGRRKALAQRTKEHGEAAVFEAIANVAGSPFHCGENERGWKANLGWMLKSPENFLKMLEMSPRGPNGSSSDLSPAERIAFHERNAEFFEKIGRHDDAAEARARAERLKATGPPGLAGLIASVNQRYGPPRNETHQ